MQILYRIVNRVITIPKSYKVLAVVGRPTSNATECGSQQHSSKNSHWQMLVISAALQLADCLGLLSEDPRLGNFFLGTGNFFRTQKI